MCRVISTEMLANEDFALGEKADGISFSEWRKENPDWKIQEPPRRRKPKQVITQFVPTFQLTF